MAEASISVSAQVELEVGERTRAWLISMGWTPPQDEALVEKREEVDRLGAAGALADARLRKARRVARRYRAAVETRSKENIDRLIEELGVSVRELADVPEALLPEEARREKAKLLYETIVHFNINVQEDLNELLTLLGVDLGELLAPTMKRS